MKSIYRNVRLPEEYGFGSDGVCVVTDGKYIIYVGKDPATDKYDSDLDCGGDLLIPAFYNAHCHAAMTLFRGFGEDLPLDRWLNERIFPAEERLNAKNVYDASMLACAEMIRNGVVSFSDMYMFEESTARAVLETGMKANLSRNLVSFDPNIDFYKDRRFVESCALERAYQNAGEGRLKIDLSLHAEYTNVESYCRRAGEYAKERGIRVQLHLSETEKEQNECIARHGKTPARFFYDCGVFDAPTTAAHCVWVTDEDIALLAEKHVTVAHNPVSNLKLGSGVMPYRKLRDAGVNIALGTDGTASNNRLDILRELQTAAILHKGVDRDPLATGAREMLHMATRNGALSQGRDDCGRIEAGIRADLVLIDLHAPHNLPVYDTAASLCFSVSSSDVRMTVSDGQVLYRDGEYLTLDIDRVKAEFSYAAAHYFD